MTNIHLVAVTYNSNEALNKYLDSIESAAAVCPDLNLQVSIADNGSNESFVQTKQYSFSLRCHKFDNPGYFGGALKIINKSESTAFDYTIISNVDVCLDHDFFVNLAKIKTDPSVGWIAPQIYSHEENRDRNPKIMARPSKKRLSLLKIMYEFPILHLLYNKTLYRRKKLQRHNRGTIYAGHGSFIILTKSFFKCYNNIEYPVFLFGEEIFLAELCMARKLSVMYAPEIKVFDSEHISTGTMKSSFYYKCNREALTFLLKKFYE